MAKLTTYQVTEIAKDTWVINEAGMTAMFLLKGTERALLIDTGVGMTDLKKLSSWLCCLREYCIREKRRICRNLRKIKCYKIS